jgi:hypothetical protein
VKLMPEERAGLLEAELELGEALVQTLEEQRDALLASDLVRINRLTEVLEEQLKLFVELIERRCAPSETESDFTGRDLELLHRAKRTEVRVMELADFNEKLIGDRLAWSTAMLSALGMSEAGCGYAPHSRPAPQVSSVRRSA